MWKGRDFAGLELFATDIATDIATSAASTWKPGSVPQSSGQT